ncbi:MAG: hypothetical protein M0P73_03160 [Syntrophobacterales bacterium]|jgi:hypothetical protein|nr:hypothetical protein [Syntrophobacterales bacterium]
MKGWLPKSSLVKFALTILLAWFLAGCAGAPVSPPVHHADDHLVQGGSLTGEGMIYFPLGAPNEKK